MALQKTPFAGFDTRLIGTSRGSVFVRQAGTGAPVLLLHGFPETGLMWHRIAELLANRFAVIVADLPGYGHSSCPPDSDDHASMSKRSLAATLIEVMRVAGHDRFAIVGHDRGGRLAYRAALDHPERITKIGVLDVLPTFEAWERADARFALAFWPFSLLAQPHPLPECLIGAAPKAIVDDAIDNWGSSRESFPVWVRNSYIDALRDPAHVHAICEEYRAAATVDRVIDEADLVSGKKIRCPLLALWSDRGGLATWYENVGGPLSIWRLWAEDVQGQAVPGGHFFPEEYPDKTSELISNFLLAEGHCSSSDRKRT
jgi:haloacetate dehalogenase